MQGRETTMWLIALNVVIFLCVWIGDALTDGNHFASYLALPSSWLLLVHRPWTLLTYMVTHESVLHILFNMMWLFLFGTLSERTIGGRRLALTYLAGGIVGGLAYMLTASLTKLIPTDSQLVGASASVLCNMTATAMRTPNLEVNLLLAGPIRLKWFALLCILLALLGMGGNSGGAIAHIGGVLTGAVIGVRERGLMQQIEFKLRLRANRHKVRRMHSQRAACRQSATETPLAPAERLDMLLDKIKTSGYGSLSTSERDELTDLSHKL